MKFRRLGKDALIWTVCIVLTACSGQVAESANRQESNPTTSLRANQAIQHTGTDTLDQQKEELVYIYTQAIAAFIQAAYKNDKSTFDSLFFIKRMNGQADDFPDIELPDTIQGVNIILLSSEAAEQIREKQNASVLVNLMGWIEKESAEFIFVAFSNGIAHQYDYFINFSFDAVQHKYQLEKIEFEDYRNSSEVKPTRKTVFQKVPSIKGK